MVYGYDPMPSELEAQYQKHILGAQGQLWTEYIRTPKEVEYMAYPRTSALSEVVWTPPEKKDYQSFLARLNVHLDRLRLMDVNYRPIERQMPCCMRRAGER